MRSDRGHVPFEQGQDTVWRGQGSLGLGHDTAERGQHSPGQGYKRSEQGQSPPDWGRRLFEGWALINALGKSKLEVLPPEPRDMQTLLELDAWENHWFPIAQAALDRRFPALSAKFFLNLAQTEGPAVAISVRTFIDRYAELGAADGKFGPEAPKAVALLIARGVTPAIIAEAEALLTKLTQVAPAETTSLAAEQEEERCFGFSVLNRAEFFRNAPRAQIDS